MVGFAAVSCGGEDDSTGPSEPVATVTVTPPAATIPPGGSVQLHALVKDAAGATMTGREVTWSSSNQDVATVSETGLVSGLSDGPVSIIASAGGKSGSAAVTVRTPVATIDVVPETAEITQSETLQFEAITRDKDGNVVTERQIAWSSSDDDVATVSQSGLVTGIAAGTARITATTEGEKGSARITVISAAIVAGAIGSGRLAPGATVPAASAERSSGSLGSP
jgi:uncharacterized protein YjdB